MSELKLKKLKELNARLQEHLDMPRLTLSKASQQLIDYVKSTKDYLVPSVWGTIDKKEDPYGPVGGPCSNCTIL
ncbi:Guanine nucleotide-binding protein subunit gamma 1 [Coelomomyces lativittatus]|nr:Guanine nucleotide-binding protein subunit gamma 1 [Coelomomyces lativittatus]